MQVSRWKSSARERRDGSLVGLSRREVMGSREMKVGDWRERWMREGSVRSATTVRERVLLKVVLVQMRTLRSYGEQSQQTVRAFDNDDKLLTPTVVQIQ
jgi:hypothetical protein